MTPVRLETSLQQFWPQGQIAHPGCAMSADVVADFLLKSLSARVLAHLGWQSASCVRPALIRTRVKHAVEFFCGTGGLVAALSQSGLRCAWYDIALDPTHDICSAGGMAAAILLTLSIVPGGVRMAWSPLQHLCLDRQGPHEAEPARPSRGLWPRGRATGEQDRREGADPPEADEHEGRLLHLGAACWESALVHA